MEVVLWHSNFLIEIPHSGISRRNKFRSDYIVVVMDSLSTTTPTTTAVVVVVVVAAFIALGLGYWYYTKRSRRENYRDPIFLNKQKLKCDIYPRTNGSIYGIYSHLMSGYPYYDRAY